MDVTEFRPAYNVELYDAGAIVTLGDGGAFSDYAIAGFEVDGDAIRRLMEHFGLAPQTARVLGVYGMESESLRDATFVVHREVKWYGRDIDLTITAISARILGPHLLDLRITARTRDGDLITTSHTYSGAFAVEWDEEENAE